MTDNDKSKAQLNSMLEGLMGATDDGEMVTIKLDMAYLGRLGLIYGDEIKNLKLTCIKRCSFGKDGDETVFIEPGKSYTLGRFDGHDIIFEAAPKKWPAMSNWEVEKYFQLELPRSQYEMIENLITSYSSKRMAKLDELSQRFLTKHTFKVGQKIRWKAELRNTPRPYEGEYAIVLEILPTPVTYRHTEKRGGSLTAGTLDDLVYGVLDVDNEFAHYLGDSRRFEPIDEA